ncbi:MAG: efflux RND transporter periplasmic adaptor subunit [Planctomycetota bacterium]|nr:MAG: efflux RND transporter periplasmic adaptor subunit [Planctomycetota bacterium]
MRSKLSVLAAIIVVVLIGIAVVAFNDSGSEAVSVGNAPGFTVRRGPLTISVSESGTIQAREQIILKSEVEGRTTILFLVEEGTRVKKGELLVELDSSKLLDAKIDQEIVVQSAEAAFIGAREDLAVTANQAQSDIDRAELDLEFAKLDLKKYLEGEYLNQRKEVESRITLAKEELEAAEEKLKWSRVLFEKEYISQRELQVDELSAHQKQLDLELAENNLNLLEDFTHPRNLAELESDVRQAEMALERTNRKAKADVVQAEADLRARESEFKRQNDKLEKNAEQIEKTKIYAPADGLVIYATSAQSRHWHSSDEPLDEGREVREREELIYLPTADAVKAEVKIHEASLEKIRAGLGVKVTVDALPGKMFTGEVAKIAPLPDAQMVWLNPDLKVYNTEIYLDGEGNNLRTGMSCRAEIIIEEYEDAVYIPVQAVIRVGGEPTVYVWDGRGFEPRVVEVGLDNNRMMRILGGLKEGEVVLLSPPLGSGTIEQGREAVTRAPGAGEGLKTRGQKPAEKKKRQRPDMKDLSDEQKQKMRERFENMSDEEKEKMRQEWMKKEGQRRGAGE